MPTDFKPQINPDGTFSAETIRAINDRIYELADEYSITEFPAEHRKHLGVSTIGHKCSRHLFYAFRWCKLNQAEPRMRRLWQRGHDEEERFKTILQWMGFFVREIDPLTDRQYNFSKINGHYGGSSDSLALLPWFRDDKSPRILVEYKTHNNKSFTKLKGVKQPDGSYKGGEGLIKSKPLHHVQMCCYGREFNTRYALYCAVNKDNDDLYFEFLELDWSIAIVAENKASDIINTRIPPPKISENPATFDCQYCDHQEICHYGVVVDTNCRSCKFAIPTENKTWTCTRYNIVIPNEHIATGCKDHSSINE